MCVCVIDGTKGAFLNTDRRWRRHTARIYSVDRTRAREGERRERGRAVIRYLGGGEGRLCQQLSGNRLALQITGFCVNVLTHRCLDYTKWSRAKVCRFVASNSRFPSSSVSSMLLIINDRTQREQNSTTTRLFGQRNRTRDSWREQSDKQLWKLDDHLHKRREGFKEETSILSTEMAGGTRSFT